MASRAPRGQAALVVVVITFVLCSAIAAGLTHVAATTRARARAQTAADAAALASVDGDRSDAVRLADLNGATVVAWHRGPGPYEVTVTVQIGGVTATSRATNAP